MFTLLTAAREFERKTPEIPLFIVGQLTVTKSWFDSATAFFIEATLRGVSTHHGDFRVLHLIFAEVVNRT